MPAVKIYDRDVQLRAQAALGMGQGTVTAAAGAATAHRNSGIVTSEALTTAGLAAYTLTLTNRFIKSTDVVLASVQNGTNTQGTVVLGRVTPANGSVVILVQNVHATEALNGTIKISFLRVARSDVKAF